MHTLNLLVMFIKLELLLIKNCILVNQIMIQQEFPRLKDWIAFEELGEQKVILELMVLLHKNY